MNAKINMEMLLNNHDLLRDISTIAGRNVVGLLGIAEWMEESGSPRKAETVRVIAHQLGEVMGELGTLLVK